MKNAGLFVSEVASHFQHCYQHNKKKKEAHSFAL